MYLNVPESLLKLRVDGSTPDDEDVPPILLRGNFTLFNPASEFDLGIQLFTKWC